MSGNKKNKSKATATGSITEDLSDSELATSIDKLLGPDSIGAPKDTRVLIRLRDGNVKPGLAEKIGLAPYRPNLPPEFILPPVVLGPVPIDLVRELAMEKILDAGEHLIKSNDRWKPLRVVFPDLLGEVLKPAKREPF